MGSLPNSAAHGAQARLSANWLARRASHEPDRTALRFKDRAWTYAALHEEVEQLAQLLAAGGLGSGDRLAYLGNNHPQFLVAFFAATRLGVVFVPLNFRLTPHELQFVLSDAGAHTLLAAGAYREVIDPIRHTLPCQRYLGLGTPRAGWEPVDTGMRAVGTPGPATIVDAESTAVIMYTSGTTGTPKGAMLSHKNLWTASINLLVTVGFNGRDVSLNSAPLFHVGGLCVVVLPVLMAGGEVVLHESFEPAAFLASITAHRVSVVFAVPAMMSALQQAAGYAQADLSSLRLLIAGGASLPPGLLRDYDARGIPVSQGWGMTESAATGTFLAPSQASRRIGSCGKPAMLSECRLVDFERRTITTPHVRGEICVRGDNVMKGYWNRPDADCESFDADGWFHSGDIGYFDEEGYFYVCDRLKDMVITGGENVYPAEVENILRDHPSVAEVAVIGAADERWGERVVAVVVLQPQAALTLDGLRHFARQRLAGYKCPTELRLLDTLPRNASGKVLKGVLRGAAPAAGPV